MSSVDVHVALLGYGTVGAAVNRLLNEQADDIERATGHRLRVVKALVRSTDKARGFPVGDDRDPRIVEHRLEVGRQHAVVDREATGLVGRAHERLHDP